MSLSSCGKKSHQDFPTTCPGIWPLYRLSTPPGPSSAVFSPVPRKTASPTTFTRPILKSSVPPSWKGQMKKWPWVTFFICFTSLSLYDFLPFQERHTWKFALPLSTDSLLTLVPFHAIFIVPIAEKKRSLRKFCCFLHKICAFSGKKENYAANRPLRR